MKLEISDEWFETFPSERELKSMKETVDLRILGEMGNAVCFKWKCVGRSPQYWIDKKYLKEV